MSNTNIYILRLEGGHFYVGKSNDVINRYQQHLNGQGSAWTNKYRPVSLERTITNASPFEEDKITKEYMSKYGIDKVRGGSYVAIELSEFHKEALKMEIWAAKDLCTQCGRPGHFAKGCYAKTDVSGNTIEYEEEDEEDDEDEEDEEDDCSDSDEDDEEVGWGCEYCDRTFTTEFGATIHEKSCRSKTSIHINSKSVGACYRCGRQGHYSPNCYASRHISGYAL